MESMIVFLIIAGLILGSFLGVVADRLPEDISIMGRSHCDHCNKRLQPLQLIPILSFLAQRGRCAYCGEKLSFRYLAMELSTGVIFALPWIIGRPEFLSSITLEQLVLWTPSSMQTWAILLSWLLIASSIIVTLSTDLRFHIILDEATSAFFFATFVLAFVRPGRLADPQVNPFVGGVVLVAILLLFYLATRGKGMGLGDVKFAFPMGMLLGTMSGLLALYIAFIVGGLYSLIILIAGKVGLRQKIAFGPFLILGMMVVFLYEREIMGLLMSFFS